MPDLLDELEETAPGGIPKWPFFVADILLIAAAGAAAWFSEWPLSGPRVFVIAGLLLAGAIAAVYPYVYYEYRRPIDPRRRTADDRGDQAHGAGAEVAAMIGRLEGLDGRLTNSMGEAAELCRILQEVARSLQQFQAMPGERRGQLQAELAELLREEDKKRAALRKQLGEAVEKVEQARAEFFASARKLEAHLSRLDEEERANRGSGDQAGGRALGEDRRKKAQPNHATTDETTDRPPTRRAGRPARNADPYPSAGLFHATKVIAVFAGVVDSHLFVRGDGGGLRWDEGIAMELIEPGKWSWATEAIEPMQVHIFRNDQEGDAGGPVMVEPGQEVCIHPKFDL